MHNLIIKDNNFVGCSMENWVELTEKINNTNVEKEEKELLKRLFGGTEYWVLAKIVGEELLKTGKKRLSIEPYYILRDQDMKAFRYFLINDFTKGDTENRSIFKVLTENENKELNSRRLNSRVKYYKLRIGLQHFKSKSGETRFTFYVDGMTSVCTKTTIIQFLSNFKLDERSMVYQLVNKKFNYITDKEFILTFNSDLEAAFRQKYESEEREFKNKINKIGEQRKIKEKELTDYETQCKEKEQEITDKLNSYETRCKEKEQEITDKLNSYETQCKEKEQEITDKLNSFESQYKEKIELLNRYNVIFSCEVENETLNDNNINTCKEFSYFDDMIAYAQDYLLKNHKLSYSKELLKSFYLGLQTDQLILLMGKPGTGKTSLVKKFAKMFGFAEAAIIPVQSNWSDKSDILGYYNPLEKNYITTQFLDSLLEFCKEAEKEENKEKLFFICLDEMNLAHIEYYFAEFLSVLQGDKVLRLYSKKIKEDIIRELKFSGFTDEEIKDLDENQISLNEKQIAEKVNNEQHTILKRQYYLNLCKMANMIANIPDEINIPERIKFIGTLNQDETTLDISPKVLDRSFIVRINGNNQENEELDLNHKYDSLDIIKYKKITEYDLKNDENNIVSKEELKTLYEKMNSISYVSKRILGQTFNHETFPEWCQVMGKEVVVDCILAATFVPRIRIFKDYDNKMKVLKDLEKNHPIVQSLIGEIDNVDEKEIDFWRR